MNRDGPVCFITGGASGIGAACVAAFGAAGLTQDILMTHGLYDGLLPILHTRRIKDRLLKLGAHIDWREYPKEHSVDPQSELPDIAEWLAKRIKP